MEGAKNLQQMPTIQDAPQIQSSAQDTLTESGGNNRKELLPLAPQQNDLSSHHDNNDENPQHDFSWGDIAS